MHIYVLFLLILSTIGALLVATIYGKFRLGLTTKLFALIVPTEIIVAELSFILGGEGAPLKLLLTLVPVGVGVVIIAMFTLYRLTIQPLMPLTEAMARIAAERDLTQQPPVTNRRDEIHTIQSSFQTVTNNLRGILSELQGGISSLAASATEIAATAHQAVSTASEQASVVAEVSATVEELRQSSKASADSARQVVTVADSALQKGKRGVEVVGDAVATMNNIASHVQAVAAKMQLLNERNQQIGEIVSSVNELAEQSNLLAVNASIEAARAGEQGRGFVAVATEVRSLAEQSKVATRQIQGILGDIRQAGETLISATQESQNRVEAGMRSMEALRAVIGELLSVLEQSSDQARQIAGGSTQQAAGVKQIADAMDNVAQGGKDTEASAKQLHQAAASLGGLGDRLKKLVSAYRV